MTMTQFAMVEELAFLVKDNLPCKHLVLSMEEALVNFLQDDTSTDGILELEPMNPYNRLLLHRLADIFGPAILVSDILWQYDGYQSSTTSCQLLRREETFPALKKKPASLQLSLEEREAAYLAARERIFSKDGNEIKQSVSQKPRNVPVVARRMIAHALGQRIDLSNDKTTLLGSIENEKQTEKIKVHRNSRSETSQEAIPRSNQCLTSSSTRMCGTPVGRCPTNTTSENEKMMQKQPVVKQSASVSVPQAGNSDRVACQEHIKREHMGAARRMFAHALGLNSTKENPGLMLKCSESKPTDNE
ncbi:uncharacterized protein LOC122669768 isoform X2 [Telopea speciosissima]|uniref:uncharacterized protein LOC122669768 isoform X2 n=1 Tax=Telopea speciosissima TaxID=54955 RepID=UPI001CC45776|nr:uncharacterized protein LOC122669768 isoform X2 [Telopea speciosissima]